MKLSFQLLSVLSLVVSTVLIAAEPCDPNDGNGHGTCCDAIYRHSLGRDDDDILPSGVWSDCGVLNQICVKGEGLCIPGLFCVS